MVRSPLSFPSSLKASSKNSFVCFVANHLHCDVYNRNNLETETDCVNTTLQELRLHLAAFISNVINSIPKGMERMKLFSVELRYSLFYLFSSWCELFGISSSNNGEQDRYCYLVHREWDWVPGAQGLGMGLLYMCTHILV